MEVYWNQVLEVNIEHFRPNLVVSNKNKISNNNQFTTMEDNWNSIRIPVIHVPICYSDSDRCMKDTVTWIQLDITHPCVRCSMINILPTTGVITSNILSSLKNYRKLQHDHSATVSATAAVNSSYDISNDNKKENNNGSNVYFGQFCKYADTVENLFSRRFFGVIKVNVNIVPNVN